MYSQTAEYALRAMAALAVHGGVMATPLLASRTRVTANYLAKVLQQLVGASLVTGRRGIGGGYRLARPPERITLLEIVNAVDEVRRIEACPLGLGSPGEGLCPLHRRLDKAMGAMIEVFEGTTLRDVMDDAGALCSAANKVNPAEGI